MTKEECKCCAEGRAPQVGGDHYAKMAIEPAKYIHANGMGYCEGNVVKYISRHASKGGAEDVRKAMQYCQFLLDWDYPGE